MNRTKRYLLSIAGVAGIVFGMVWLIPSFIEANYGFASVSGIMIVGGIVLLAIAFGD